MVPKASSFCSLSAIFCCSKSDGTEFGTCRIWCSSTHALRNLRRRQRHRRKRRKRMTVDFRSGSSPSSLLRAFSSSSRWSSSCSSLLCKYYQKLSLKSINSLIVVLEWPKLEVVLCNPVKWTLFILTHPFHKGYNFYVAIQFTSTWNFFSIITLRNMIHFYLH